MSGKPKRQKRNMGDIVRISLGDGLHSYGRVLSDAEFAIYDALGGEDLSVDTVVKLPILFKVYVMDRAVKSGRWVVVGNTPLDESLQSPEPRFIQDAIRKEQFRIYEKGRMRPATKEECAGLECAAVWDPEDVEERIRDHYAGRKNISVESMKIKD